MATNIFDDIDSSTMISVNVNGVWMVMTVATFLSWLQDNISVGTFVTQYSAPVATGFTATIVSDNQDRHLILTPAAGYANGTIVLPAASTCRDGQRLLVNCTQIVTALAYTLNGAAAVVGGYTGLASANLFFELKFDQPTLNWYRVG